MNAKNIVRSCLCAIVAGSAGLRLVAETRVVDKVNGPYYTIQDAVDAAADGDIVFIKNGVHDQGGAVDGFSSSMSNRVYLTKSLTLAGESKEGAIIKGAHATDAAAALGCGADAVRVLGINADNVVVSNLTLTGGATHNSSAGNDAPENNGGGVYVANGKTGIVLVDCIVSNNVARRAGAVRYGNDAASSHANCLLVRTWLHENKAGTGGGPAVRGCLVAHSLFTRHYSNSALTYAATFVNCTFADGYCRNQSGSADVAGYNCLFADSWYRDDGVAQWFNCAFNKDVAETSSATSECILNPGFDLFMAPPLVNYRLHAGATTVIGKGNAEYLTLIPEAYRNTDFYGHAVNAASVSLGCAQEVVTPAGGTLTFAGQAGMSEAKAPTGHAGSTTTYGLYSFNGVALGSAKDLGYIRTTEGRTVVTVTHDPTGATQALALKGLHSFAASGADTRRRFARPDGAFVLAAPSAGKTLTLTPTFNYAAFTVDRASTAAAPDGTEAAPYASLRAALDAVPSGKFATIRVKAGVYDNETMTQTRRFGNVATDAYAHKARAVVPANVSLVGAGAETTFIVGASDPEAAAESSGCGPNAVRCVALAKGARLTGFTLTGGRTDRDGNGDDFHGGGVLAEFGTAETLATVTDCVISNCVARRGGGGFHGVYNRVRFLDNSVILGGNGAAVRGNGANNCFLANCVIDRNEGYATVYYPTLLNCTFGADNTQNGNKDGMVLIADSGDIRNCLFLGPNSAIGKTNAVGEVTATRFYDCVFSPQMKAHLDRQNAKTDGNKVFVDASCTATTELAVADDLTPVVGANAAVDAANADGYDAATWGELDVYGNPRRVNGRRLDVGAVEADWKARYTEAIECRFQVTAADPAVELVANGVLIPAGASLAATVGRAGVANGAYVLSATVNGKACAVTQDGAAARALMQGVNEVRYETGATGLTDLVFTADASGSTVLAALKAASCMFMILR